MVGDVEAQGLLLPLQVRPLVCFDVGELGFGRRELRRVEHGELVLAGPLESTRSQKSKMSSKGPASFLAAMMESTHESPTFLTAESPNRMVSPTTVKRRPLSFTSGGRTSIFMALASATYWGTLSLVFITLLIRAAMYASG